MTSLLIGKVKDEKLFDVTFVDESTGVEFDADFYSILAYILKENVGLCMINILACVMGLVLLGFFGYHLYLISQGQTTNESFKWSALKSVQKKFITAHKKYLELNGSQEEHSGNYENTLDIDDTSNNKEIIETPIITDVHDNTITTSTIMTNLENTDLEGINLNNADIAVKRYDLTPNIKENNKRLSRDTSLKLTIINSVGEEEGEEEDEEGDEEGDEEEKEDEEEKGEKENVDAAIKEIEIEKEEERKHLNVLGYKHSFRVFMENEDAIPELLSKSPDPFPENIYNKGFFNNLR